MDEIRNMKKRDTSELYLTQQFVIIIVRWILTYREMLTSGVYLPIRTCLYASTQVNPHNFPICFHAAARLY